MARKSQTLCQILHKFHLIVNAFHFLAITTLEEKYNRVMLILDLTFRSAKPKSLLYFLITDVPSFVKPSYY